MVPLYDPKDESDLLRVENLLRKGAIEYFLVPASGAWPIEIQIAEEDIPQAEALLQKSS